MAVNKKEGPAQIERDQAAIFDFVPASSVAANIAGSYPLDQSLINAAGDCLLLSADIRQRGRKTGLPHALHRCRALGIYLPDSEKDMWFD